MLGFGALAETALAEIPLEGTAPPPVVIPPSGGGKRPRKPVRPIWDIQKELEAKRSAAANAPPAPDIAPDIAPIEAKKPDIYIGPKEGAVPFPWTQLVPPERTVAAPPPKIWARSNLIEDADTAPLGLPAEPVIPDAHGHLREADDKLDAQAIAWASATANLAEDQDHVLADAALGQPDRHANLVAREDGDQIRSSATADDDDEAIALLLQ